MTAPLKVKVAVLEEAQPVLDFLQEHHYDIGSIHADRLSAAAPADMRFLCVALADQTALVDLLMRMHMAWPPDAPAIKLTDRVALLTTPLDTLLVIFLDIVAIEA